MSPTCRLPTVAVLLACLAGTIAGCNRPSAGNDVVAAAPGSAASGATAPVSSPAVASADPTKSGEAYVEELEKDPALFEKQKTLCRGQGGAQPTRDLEMACADWDEARHKLEEQQVEQQGGVKNTDSL